MSLRFTPPAAEAMRAAIAEAGGVEVFAIGDVERGQVTEITVCARGTADKVLAVLGRPRAGQVVIHNHPSGDLTPSDPDLSLAARYSEDGVGFVIVDSGVERSNFVVEPWDAAPVAIDPAEVDRLFTEVLPGVLKGAEVRDAQRQMAAAVTATLNEGRPLVVEAGTGTGKSLAYLIPAALWAKANDSKVVIATHTRALQAQLLAHDLPLLAAAGIEVRTAVLEGRGNYLCKRRLGLAIDEQADLPPEARDALDLVKDWAESTEVGSRTELGFRLPGDVWDRVNSDTDLTLRMRCEHYDSCHFYQARRRAAAAHVVVVNHALLMADLAVREDAGVGVLPVWRRVILDEAHHLEDAATGLAASSVSAEAIRRAVAPLLPRKKKPGSLARLRLHIDSVTTLPPDVRDRVRARLDRVRPSLEALPDAARRSFGELANVLSPETPTKRVDAAFEEDPEWTDLARPQLEGFGVVLEDVAGELGRVMEAFGDHRLPDDKAQPLLDLGRATRRLSRHAGALRRFLDPPPTDEDTPPDVRWMELARRRSDRPEAVVRSAPVDVAPVLQRLLWHPRPGAVCTSATLSVGNAFTFFEERHGLKEPEELLLPSPFDHFQQAILGLPTDLPPPDHPRYLRETARRIVDAVEISRGGAFVLCTSYRAVDAYAEALRRTLRPGVPVLAQGTRGRGALLAEFRERPDSILVGTDSFWEGVSVKGHGLRLVILPRLPFRVPTDPLQQARHEQLQREGLDPFRADTLPRAVLKLRQGYGRLLRSRADRGAVLLLDTRVHDRSYGRIVLGALPPARRVKGPWPRVADALRALYADMSRS